MKANELRLGNLVYIYSEPNPVRLPIEIAFSVSKIELGNIGLKKGSITNPQNDSLEFEIGLYDIIPIELTSEWLRNQDLSQFPFEIFGDNQRGFHIALENGNWIMIKHVHHLQNLYFALTGEELEID